MFPKDKHNISGRTFFFVFLDSGGGGVDDGVCVCASVLLFYHSFTFYGMRLIFPPVLMVIVNLLELEFSFFYLLYLWIDIIIFDNIVKYLVFSMYDD